MSRGGIPLSKNRKKIESQRKIAQKLRLVWRSPPGTSDCLVRSTAVLRRPIELKGAFWLFFRPVHGLGAFQASDASVSHPMPVSGAELSGRRGGVV
jgi:hypothetical protein